MLARGHPEESNKWHDVKNDYFALASRRLSKVPVLRHLSWTSCSGPCSLSSAGPTGRSSCPATPIAGLSLTSLYAAPACPYYVQHLATRPLTWKRATARTATGASTEAAPDLQRAQKQKQMIDTNALSILLNNSELFSPNMPSSLSPKSPYGQTFGTFSQLHLPRALMKLASRC